MSRKKVVVGSVVEFDSIKHEGDVGRGVVVALLTTVNGTTCVVAEIVDYDHDPDRVSISSVWVDLEKLRSLDN